MKLFVRIFAIFHIALGFCVSSPDAEPSQLGYNKNTFREITPIAGPRVASGINLFITADFIWWKAREDGVGYAISGYNATQPPVRGKVLHPRFEYEPGFKAGAGIGFNHDGWDLYAQYTWLSPSCTCSFTSIDPATSNLHPLWFIFLQNRQPVTSSTLLEFASGDWKLLFNVVDTELGRNFFISQFLTLRPFIGLKGTWQKQSFIVKYTSTNGTDPLNFLRMGAHETFWGIGIRPGLNTGWHYNKNWSIFGDFALTALWSDFSIQRRDRDLLNGDAEAEVTFYTENSFHSLKPILEIAVGLRYETWFNNDDFHIMAQVGWEEQLWWSRNQFIRIFEESAHGDLNFYGLTGKARFDF